MASDDKKTSPAPKNEAAVKKEAAAKMRGSRRTRPRPMQTHLRLRPARKLPIHPQVIVGARGKNRFRKHIGITGTRFTQKRKRRSGNWIIEAVSPYLIEPKAGFTP